jgi:phage terminase Nu1 subunit (DNA packaging protein)
MTGRQAYVAPRNEIRAQRVRLAKVAAHGQELKHTQARSELVEATAVESE